MLIYQTTARQFIDDVRTNRLTGILMERFDERAGRKAGFPEITSWQNSLPRVMDLLELAGLTDNWIALEYQIPYNQLRVDCLLFGKDSSGADTMVLIELKQWAAVEAIVEGGVPEENYRVQTFTGQKYKSVAHPSEQVKGYDGYLKSHVVEL